HRLREQLDLGHIGRGGEADHLVGARRFEGREILLEGVGVLRAALDDLVRVLTEPPVIIAEVLARHPLRVVAKDEVEERDGLRLALATRARPLRVQLLDPLRERVRCPAALRPAVAVTRRPAMGDVRVAADQQGRAPVACRRWPDAALASPYGGHFVELALKDASAGM